MALMNHLKNVVLAIGSPRAARVEDGGPLRQEWVQAAAVRQDFPNSVRAFAGTSGKAQHSAVGRPTKPVGQLGNGSQFARAVRANLDKFIVRAISRLPLGIQVPSQPGRSLTRRGDPPSTGKAQRDCSISAPVKLPTSSSDLSGEILSRETFENGVEIGTVSPPEDDTWAITKRPLMFS